MANGILNRYLKVALLSTALTALPLTAMADPWVGFNKEGGDATLSGDLTSNGDGITNITQSGDIYIGNNPNGLNIGLSESVAITQDSTQALFVAKDGSNDTDPTRILGSLSTRLGGGGTGGSVMILDANGVFFGKESVIDTGGIIASSGQLDTQKLINDNIVELSNFTSGSSIEIEEGAEFDIAESGLAAFVAPTVINNGIIRAELARVELAGTNRVTTVDLFGDGLVEIEIDEENTEALSAVNNGEIFADGGVIHMTAGAAENIVDSVVNMNGVARAKTASLQNGKIILGGADTGTVDVNTEVMADDIAVNGQVAQLNADLNAPQLDGTAQAVTVESEAAEIQDAVDIAASGATINVASGTYEGDIRIDNSVNLLGAQAGVDAKTRQSVSETIIDMQSPGITVTANNTIIDGVTVSGGTSGDAAIIIDGANNVRVRNTIIDDVTGGAEADGIWIQDSTGSIVNKNLITTVEGDAVSARGMVNGLEVSYNRLNGADDKGISLDNTSGHVSLLNNNISNADNAGIFVRASDGVTIDTNTIAMDVNSNSGIKLDNQNGDDLFISTTLRNNTILGQGTGTGITIADSSYIRVNGNVIGQTETGLNVADSDEIYAATNLIRIVEDGMIIEGSDYAVLDQNGITGFSDTGITLLDTTNAIVTDNVIKSESEGTVGIDVIGTDNTVIAGNLPDGNRIENVQTGIRLIADNGTLIDGNTINNTRDAIRSGGTPAPILELPIFEFPFTQEDEETVFLGEGEEEDFVDEFLFALPNINLDSLNDDAENIGVPSSGLVIVNNDIDSAVRAITLNDVQGLQIGRVDEGNIITNSGGMRVTDSTDVNIDSNIMNEINGNAIFVTGSNGANVLNNVLNTITLGNGIVLRDADTMTASSNMIEAAAYSGIVTRGTNTSILNANNINNNGFAGILVDGSTGTTVADNTLNNNNAGIIIAGFNNFVLTGEIFGNMAMAAPLGGVSDGTAVVDNNISNSATAGISTNGNAVGSASFAGNTLTGNSVGMSFEGGSIDLSDFNNPNTVSGGETGIIFAPNFFVTEGAEEEQPNPLSLVNNTLGATIFDGQSGNFVELYNGALFAPGEPTITDGLGVSWDGLVPLDSPLGAGIITAAQRSAIEARLIDFDDTSTVGQIITGLGFDADEEDTFSSGLFSLNFDPNAINVTFVGLPPVTLDLTALEPAAGGDDNDDPQNLQDIEPAAGGDEGCWAAVNENAFEGTVTFSFGGSIANAIEDSACATTQQI